MNKQDIELRFSSFEMTEEDSGDSLKVSGYVNEVGKYSCTLGIRKKFKEKITKGAFERALGLGNDIHFLAEHDGNKILASTRNNSLELMEDDKGLYMSATISPTSFGKDYYTLIKDGILKNMSFGFSVIKDKWTKMNDGTYTRDISDLVLYEVSVVTDPAYPQSSISARGLNLVGEDVPEEVLNENNDVKEAEELPNKNEEIVKDTKTQEVEEVANEIKTEEAAPQVKTEEVEAKEVGEVKESEKRSYIFRPWSKTEAMDVALSITANCASLIQYCIENNDENESYKNTVAECRKFIQIANQFIFDATAPADEAKNTEVSEEIIEKKSKETVKDEVRSSDLTDYFKRLQKIGGLKYE